MGQQLLLLHFCPVHAFVPGKAQAKKDQEGQRQARGKASCS